MFSQEDPFTHSKYSIKRAKLRTQELIASIQTFEAKNPFAFVTELDGSGEFNVYKFKLIKAMPEELSGLAFEIANYLRSALDQCMFAIGGKGTYFPVASDAAHLPKGIKGRCKNVHRDIIAFIETVKPYKGGNDLIWALNELANSNKHAVLCPIAVYTSGFRLESLMLTEDQAVIRPIPKNAATGNDFMRIPAPVWNRTKNEMALIHHPVGTKVHAELSVPFQIAINGVEFIDGQPAVGVLNELTRQVERITMALEFEARRLGVV